MLLGAGTFFLVSFVVGALAVWLPSLIALRAGRVRREMGWVEKARHVTRVRSYIVVVGIALPATHAMVTRVILDSSVAAITIALLGAYVMALGADFGMAGVGRAFRKLHSFPPSAIPGEVLRMRHAGLMRNLAFLLPMVAMPKEWDQRATVVALVSLGLFAVSTFGFVGLWRIVGLVRPLPADLDAFVVEQARAQGLRAPATVELRATLANAFALPLHGVVAITSGALAVVPPEGCRAILAHELEHLRQGKALGWSLVIPELLLLSLAVVFRPLIEVSPALMLAATAVAWVVTRQLRLLRHRFEHGADHGASSTAGVGDYSTALVALYEANLFDPAPLVGGSHPGLAERLEQLGRDTDLPTKSQPSAWPFVTAMLLALVWLFVALAVRQALQGYLT